ncbi:MAG: hypothetical protein ABIG93_02315 [archaeon]
MDKDILSRLDNHFESLEGRIQAGVRMLGLYEQKSADEKRITDLKLKLDIHVEDLERFYQAFPEIQSEERDSRITSYKVYKIP